MNLKQGNTYQLPVELTKDDEPLDINEVETVEFTFGGVIKNYPSNDVRYDSENGIFIVYLSQEDTFSLQGNIGYQIRIKFVSQDTWEDVKGTDIQQGYISNSISKVVL